jgi:hypothetical protein
MRIASELPAKNLPTGLTVNPESKSTTASRRASPHGNSAAWASEFQNKGKLVVLPLDFLMTNN